MDAGDVCAMHANMQPPAFRFRRQRDGEHVVESLVPHLEGARVELEDGFVVESPASPAPVTGRILAANVQCVWCRRPAIRSRITVRRGG
jgi:hypothetical protein